MNPIKHVYYIENRETPRRFDAFMSKRSEMLDSSAEKHDKRIQRKLSLLSSLRRRKQFREDVHELRLRLGIPKKGYTRREVDALLKRIEGTELETPWWGVTGDALEELAKRNPLDKTHPLPFVVAFELLFFKRPKATFSPYSGLMGYYKNGKFFSEDLKTKPPAEVARKVDRKVKGHDHRGTKDVRIAKLCADEDLQAGLWALTEEPSKDRSPIRDKQQNEEAD